MPRIDPEEVRRLYGLGKKDASIARKLNCTAVRVCQIRAELHLPNVNGRNRAWLPSEVAEMLRLLAAGLTRHEIARRIDRTHAAVKTRIQIERRLGASA